MLMLTMAGKGRYLGSFSLPEIFGVLCPLSDRRKAEKGTELEGKRREDLSRTKLQPSN